MLDKDTLAQVSDAFAALDFSEETERLAALNATTAEIGDADTKARKRIGELDALIRDYREPSGDEVAAALLDGSDAKTAATAGVSLATLQDERARLLPALNALRHKSEDVRVEAGDVRSAIATKVRDAAKPLADAIIADARTAVERLADCYASLGAIAAMGAPVDSRANDIAKVINAAAGLAGNTRIYPVPAEITAVLSSLEGKPGLRGARVPQSIPAPGAGPNIVAIAAAAAAASARSESAAPNSGLQPAPLRANRVWDRAFGR
jgi:hypothetical protein